ncbi:unnamed protein product [Spirodela intermedia]|uniref:DUF1421 domain-containing protein n=1 Tax=Spirodela intermedia TaxID=51605 RepID=A0A7I8LF34_SPIIN|nr:unnamed protein product [Spirodela intermedia]
MASGGSSGRPPSVSRSFDFGSDDVLCSYDDIGSQDHSNGKRSDSAGKDFREGRVGRPLVDVYSQREEHDNRDLLLAVEKCMKKYADNLLRFLEGISGRLSQLELYCYNLERSVGDLRADLSRDQSESDLKLKSLEKHLQEVHRSVQILRDKQELAETQRELAKIQLATKESSDTATATATAAAAAAPEPKKRTDSPDASNQQLALALPQQLPPNPPPPRAPEQAPPQPDPYTQAQGGGPFYPQRSQMMTPMPPPPQQQQHQHQQQQQPEQQQYAPQRPQAQDFSRQPPPQYEQPWAPQQQPAPQHFSQPQRPETPPAYAPYAPSQQPPNAAPHEMYPPGMPLQAPYQRGYAPAQLSLQRQEVAPPQTGQSPYPPPQVSKAGGYAAPVPYPPHSNVQSYGAPGGGGAARPQHFLPGAYPPPGGMHQGMQMPRSHPYAELIDKAINMGYLRDHVIGAVRRMEESGQPVDFNSLLDVLNARPAAPPSQRGWAS